jgi:hypothetical protein
LNPVNLADFPSDQAATDFAMSRIHEVVQRERVVRVS